MPFDDVPHGGPWGFVHSTNQYDNKKTATKGFSFATRAECIEGNLMMRNAHNGGFCLPTIIEHAVTLYLNIVVR